MPLDDGGIRRGAKLGDIDHLQRCCRHQIAHQRVTKRTADDPDDKHRHPKEGADRASARGGFPRELNLQPRQRDNRGKLNNGDGEKAAAIENIGDQIDRPPRDFRSKQPGRQPAGENIGNRLWSLARRHAVRCGIAVIAGNPHRHTKPHTATAEHQAIRCHDSNPEAGCRQAADQNPDNQYRPTAEPRHQKRGWQGNHHRRQKLQ